MSRYVKKIISTQNENYYYYLFKNIGLPESHRKIIHDYHLYYLFPPEMTSTFYEIMNENKYHKHEMNYLFGFDSLKGTVFGLYLFLNFHSQNELNAIGQIHLFTKASYRRNGLSKEAALILDNELKNIQENILMMGDAKFLIKDLKNIKAMDSNYIPHFPILK